MFNYCIFDLVKKKVSVKLQWHSFIQPSAFCFRWAFDLLQISTSVWHFRHWWGGSWVWRDLPGRMKLYPPPSCLPGVHFISDCPEMQPKTGAVTETRPADELRSMQGPKAVKLRADKWRGDLGRVSERLLRERGLRQHNLCAERSIKVLCSLGMQSWKEGVSGILLEVPGRWWLGWREWS